MIENWELRKFEIKIFFSNFKTNSKAALRLHNEKTKTNSQILKNHVFIKKQQEKSS
jgi:hypothetical protein